MAPVARPDKAQGSERRGAGRSKGSARRDREILDAAAKVFYERGYMNARVQDVAEEVGLLKGSLYHYIKGKEDVLFRLLDETHDEVHRILDEVAARPDSDPPLDRLREYVCRQVEFNTDNLVRVSVYYRDLECLSKERLRELVRRRRMHEVFVVDLIAQAQERGEVDPELDAAALSKCVFAIVIWTYRWYSPGRDAERGVGPRCAEFAIDGLTGPRALYSQPTVWSGSTPGESK